MARELAQQAPHVGSTTMTLVNIMDWAYSMEDLMEPWQAIDIDRHVLDTREQVLLLHHQHHNQFSVLQLSSSKDDTQGKSPVCTRCSNRYYPRRHPLAACVPSCVRTLLESDPLPPWFKCLGRWDFRERLPNKQTPLWGFDLDQKPTTSASAESAAPSTARYFGLGGNYRAQSQVSSSLDQQMELPIDLIGQKFQLFHLCLESVVVEESGLSPDGIEQP